MIDSLNLLRFKNFRNATLKVGSLTVLIGANASGKSNIRDAFRFLHGIGRGYSLAEILGEKYVGGERIWGGIRGGTREVSYLGSDSFRLKVEMSVTSNRFRPPGPHPLQYSIEVMTGGEHDKPPRIHAESLSFWPEVGYEMERVIDKRSVKVTFERERRVAGRHPPARNYMSIFPVLSQVADDEEVKARISRMVSRVVCQEFEGFRFLDLSPAQMRIPSIPGQSVLGDRGENLSSVLAAICEDVSRKEALVEWMRRLTPMDVDDFVFDQDAAGRILLSLKETDGRTISAQSASDGTLRFLGILAALFGPTPASLYFVEELENGIHPTRLSLLADLIETQTRRRNIQVVATCHAPLLLQFLSEPALANASIVYRLPDRPDAKIKRLLDVPGARRVIKEQTVGLLHASSWFEDALNLSEPDSSNGDHRS